MRKEIRDTIAWYDAHYEAFEDTAAGSDLKYHFRRFFFYVHNTAPVLVAGCGNGRDAEILMDKGFTVEAIDGSQAMCRLARKNGVNAEHMLFEEIEEEEKYAGIFACMSFSELPFDELIMTVKRMIRALKKGAVIYMSFPLGEAEGMKDGRWCTEMNQERLAQLITALDHVTVSEVWKSSSYDTNEGRWMNCILRRTIRQ